MNYNQDCYKHPSYFYAILFNMDLSRPFWSDWATALRRKRLNLWLAWFLDAVGPFNILGAQFIHLAAPFLGNSAQSKALANLLEDGEETRAFIKLLRENS